MRRKQSVLGAFVILAWWALASWAASSCASVHVNPSNPDFREDQVACTQVVGQFRNHVAGKSTASWCATSEGVEWWGGIRTGIDALNTELDQIEAELLGLKKEVEELNTTL